MTRLQRQVLLYIQDCQDSGISPTVREISDGTDRKVANVHHAMRVLVSLGYLTCLPRQSRSYEVVRRIEPIVEHWVWDDEAKALRPLKGREAA